MKEDKYTKRRYKAFLVLEKEDRIFPVYIMRFPEGDGAEVIMRLEDDSMSSDDLLPLGENKMVLVKVDVNGGSLDIYRGTLVYRLGLQIHLRNVHFEETLQRRNDVKVPMVEPGMIMCLDAGREDVVIPVTFLDISAGGVGFQLDQKGEEEILEGDTFQFCFDKGKHKMYLDFEVCRVQEKEDGSVNCGGRFISLGRGQEAEIRKYAFEIERREIIRQRQIQDFLELENENLPEIPPDEEAAEEADAKETKDDEGHGRNGKKKH